MRNPAIHQAKLVWQRIGWYCYGGYFVFFAVGVLLDPFWLLSFLALLGSLVSWGMRSYYSSKELASLPELLRALGNPRRSAIAEREIEELGREAVATLREALRSPIGTIGSSDTSPPTWNGALARRLAAKWLAELRCVEAFDDLVGALDDQEFFARTYKTEVLQALLTLDEERTRSLMIEALEKKPDRIRTNRKFVLQALTDREDQRVIPYLIPMLGEFTSPRRMTSREPTHDDAVRLLGELGESELVELFQQALQGDRSAREAIRNRHRNEFVLAFRRGLHTAVFVDAARCAQVLGELEALEARRDLQRFASAFESGRSLQRECQKALARLDAKAKLPRPASNPAPSKFNLPVSVHASPINETDLPRLTNPPEGHTVWVHSISFGEGIVGKEGRPPETNS